MNKVRIDYASIKNWKRPVKQIAAELGCSKEAVYAHIWRMGMAVQRKGKVARKLAVLRDDQWRKASDDMLASLLGCCPPSVRNYRRNHAKPLYKSKPLS